MQYRLADDARRNHVHAGEKLLQSVQPPTFADLLALAEIPTAPTGNAGVYAHVVVPPTGSLTQDVRPILHLESVLEHSKNSRQASRRQGAAIRIPLMAIPEPIRIAMPLTEAQRLIIVAEAVLAVWLGAPDWASHKLRQASP
jgi:hypothetical protein